jgi:hypothetical protein
LDGELIPSGESGIYFLKGGYEAPIYGENQE